MAERTSENRQNEGPCSRQDLGWRKQKEIKFTEPFAFQSEWLGEVPYLESLEIQKNKALQVKESSVAQILGLEHPFVITLGRRSHGDPQAPRGSHVVPVERGGEVTLHSPGQLVIYPIVKIRDRWLVREWVDLLLDVTEATLQQVGVVAKCGPHAGLWTSKGKIASIGLRIGEGISTHGLAINVNNDLGLFRQITPCGLKNGVMDSVAEQGVLSAPESLFELWIQEFSQKLRSKA